MDEEIKEEAVEEKEGAGMGIEEASGEKSRGEVKIEGAAGEKSEEEKFSSKTSRKEIFVIIALVVGIFAVFLVGPQIYSRFTGAQVINIDEMHQENLEEELGEGEGYVYNGYSFVYADGLWWTEMNKFGTLLKVPLHFGPKELEDIPIGGKLDPRFNFGEGIYVALDPNVYNKYYTLAVSELSFNMVKGMDRIPIGACTEENYVCENRTLISCADNPENLPVVELAFEEGPGIELIGTCIKVKGNFEYDIVKAVNRLLYGWYGVME